MIVLCIKQYLSNIWGSSYEKVKQLWGWVEKRFAYKKKCLVLNCRRFSYFRSFTHDIMTENTTHSKKYIFIGAIPQVPHLERRRE